MSRGKSAAVAVCLCLLSACSKGSSPAPVPPAGGTETISGRERIGWDQPAINTAEVASLRYAIYVDGARTDLTEINCDSMAGAAGFPCSGRLPQMPVGAHVLEIAAYTGAVESARSAPFHVTVTGVTAGDSAAAVVPLANGEIITTDDGIELRAEMLADELDLPSALAVTADGRAFVGTAAGLILVRAGEIAGPPQKTDGHVVAIALSPTFERDGQIYVTETVPSASGGGGFRTSRFRDVGGRLGERLVILESGPAATRPAAALRFGPEGKLFLAFDDGDSASASHRMSEWSGKLLRMEADGRTPSDQPAASPVLVAGLTSPRGFDWPSDFSSLWIADAVRDGTERLRVIASTSERPKRAAQRDTLMLPKGLGAAALSFYRGTAIPGFSGDLLVAGRDAGYLLRLRFAPDDRTRPVTTERLLKGRAGSVPALAVSPDGDIYFCTATALIRLRQSTVDSR